MNTWFCSDPHYGHKNIVQGESKWDSLQACRNFDNLQEMNVTLVKNINDNVKEGDILYCLGDWSFGGLENVYEFRKQLNVKTIHLILGNHDHHIENNRQLFGVCTQDIFTSVQHYLSKKINGQNMVLSHYSMRTWDKAHHGTWMLYGHSHGTLSEYKIDNSSDTSVKGVFKTMDVGFDTHVEFRPYHFDELQDIMQHRIPLLVDHHTANTN